MGDNHRIAEGKTSREQFVKLPELNVAFRKRTDDIHERLTQLNLSTPAFSREMDIFTLRIPAKFIAAGFKVQPIFHEAGHCWSGC